MPENDKKCPNCGNQLVVKQPSQVGGWLLIILGLLFTPILIGIILIIIGISSVSKNSNPFWYCINCGYRQGKQYTAPQPRSVPLQVKSIDYSGKPYFILSAEFRNNPDFLNGTEEERHSFELAYREYSTNNYVLAADALESILFDNPKNQAAWWGKLGLLFTKPLSEIPITKPLTIIREMLPAFNTQDDKNSIIKAVLNIINEEYTYLGSVNAHKEEYLRPLLSYVDFLVGIVEDNTKYRKYALELLECGGLVNTPLWNQYHDALYKDNAAYREEYDNKRTALAAAKAKQKKDTRIATLIAVFGTIAIAGTFITFVVISINKENKLKEESQPAVATPAVVPKTTVGIIVYEEGLWVREKPSSSGKKIVKLKKNDTVDVLSYDDEWAVVKTRDGTNGYVKRAFAGEKTILIEGVDKP